MSRRDENGRFSVNPRALDIFGTEIQDVRDAYILWSLKINQDTYDGFAKEFENLS